LDFSAGEARRAAAPRQEAETAEAASRGGGGRAKMTKSGDDFVTKLSYEDHEHGL
jgi:hypothetical protein